MRYFTLFLLNLYIAIFFATLVNSVYGLPNHVRRIALLATVDCFFSMALFLTLWLYQKQFLGESAVTRAVSVFIPAVLAVYAAALILNLFHPILFFVTDEGVYFEGMMGCFSVVIDASCLISLCAATLFSNLNWNRKLSFICCVFSPVLLTVLSLNMDARNRSTYVLSLLITFVLLPVCLIFYNANDELEKEVLRHEKEQIELQVSAMISQMQPHFLYNCLSVIAALCEEDPGLAAKATNAFSDYLRENISFANKSGPISFSEELLAYLVNKEGVLCPSSEISGVLFQGGSDSYLRVAKKDLKRILSDLGQEAILVRGWGVMGINRKEVRCDYFDYLDGKPGALNLYKGAYMSQYGWARGKKLSNGPDR